MSKTVIERAERKMLDRLAAAIKKRDAGDTSTEGEIALARWDLQQFYRSIGLHP